ncbi:uncharacterized protein LOC129392996 [Pan paniscus]|uniref:uncharacterized protein LOC129392996 n=1 Tax=Pan paniscus TaxID=9597 RepID=UPI0024368D94|nr:uncharacterized protein LOC129392996 [Pan paniscus]
MRREHSTLFWDSVSPASGQGLAGPVGALVQERWPFNWGPTRTGRSFKKPGAPFVEATAIRTPGEGLSNQPTADGPGDQCRPGDTMGDGMARSCSQGPWNRPGAKTGGSRPETALERQLHGGRDHDVPRATMSPGPGVQQEPAERPPLLLGHSQEERCGQERENPDGGSLPRMADAAPGSRAAIQGPKVAHDRPRSGRGRGFQGARRTWTETQHPAEQAGKGSYRGGCCSLQARRTQEAQLSIRDAKQGGGGWDLGRGPRSTPGPRQEAAARTQPWARGLEGPVGVKLSSLGHSKKVEGLLPPYRLTPPAPGSLSQPSPVVLCCVCLVETLRMFWMELPSPRQAGPVPGLNKVCVLLPRETSCSLKAAAPSRVWPVFLPVSQESKPPWLQLPTCTKLC